MIQPLAIAPPGPLFPIVRPGNALQIHSDSDKYLRDVGLGEKQAQGSGANDDSRWQITIHSPFLFLQRKKLNAQFYFSFYGLFLGALRIQSKTIYYLQ